MRAAWQNRSALETAEYNKNTQPRNSPQENKLSSPPRRNTKDNPDPDSET